MAKDSISIKWNSGGGEDYEATIAALRVYDPAPQITAGVRIQGPGIPGCHRANSCTCRRMRSGGGKSRSRPNGTTLATSKCGYSRRTTGQPRRQRLRIG